MNALNSVRRNARGRLLPGARLNPGGRPISGVTEIRARFSRRLPEIFDRLMEMATDNSQPGLVQLAAIRLALDHLVGRPAISIDAVTTKFDFGAAYLEALRRVNSRVVEGRADTVGQTPDGNSGNSTISGGATAASDPVENKSDPTK
jgi:hypothetical protein